MKVVLKTFDNREDYENNINEVSVEELDGISVALERGRVLIRKIRHARKENPNKWRGCKVFSYQGEELYKLPLC